MRVLRSTWAHPTDVSRVALTWMRAVGRRRALGCVLDRSTEGINRSAEREGVHTWRVSAPPDGQSPSMGEPPGAPQSQTDTSRDADVHAFLIADVRGYTAFTQERGDEEAGRLAGRFAEVARAVVEAHRGNVLELRGDEALVVFGSPRSAIRGAVAYSSGSSRRRSPIHPFRSPWGSVWTPVRRCRSYYADKLSAELFAEEEVRLSGQIQAVRREQEDRQVERSRLSDVAAKFEEVARILGEMDVERLWAEATDLERRVLVEELLDSVAMYPDHLEVTVSGAPRLNVTLEEVGLTGGWQFRGVGGGI